MKEHKYRYWDQFNGCSVYSDSFNNNLKCYFRGLADFFNNLALSDEGENNPVLEQYTGLNDKNGKEIYEGDIVTRGDGNFVAEFKNNGFYHGYVACMNNDTMSYIHLWYDNLEVIGNIHENPELLENK